MISLQSGSGVASENLLGLFSALVRIVLQTNFDFPKRHVLEVKSVAETKRPF